MTCCAIAPCADPACAVCSVSRRFPPIVGCAEIIDGRRCCLVLGHRPPCRPGKQKRTTRQVGLFDHDGTNDAAWFLPEPLPLEDHDHNE